MRGWLAVPLIGFDGQNYGFVRLATLTSAARDGLAQLHLPEYRVRVGT